MPRIIITVPGSSPQPYHFNLDRKSVTLGRGSINDIVLDSGSVSVKHAEMRRVEGGYELRDLGSTNGMRYKNSPCEVVPLRDGDQVSIGDVSFTFTLSDDEKQSLGTERPMEDSPIVRENVESAVLDDSGRPDLPPLPPEGESDAERSADAVENCGEDKSASQENAGDEAEEPKRRSGLGCMWVIATLLVAALAFAAGMAVRYDQDTQGDSWIRSVIEHFSPSDENPSSAPSADPDAAPDVDE